MEYISVLEPIYELANSNYARKFPRYWRSTNRCKNFYQQNVEFLPINSTKNEKQYKTLLTMLNDWVSEINRININICQDEITLLTASFKSLSVPFV